ncbi:zf-HC2 domain-containing protein [Xanthomonas arboricola pv. corylina]|nr:zf-HC2 domain-containing protein [Xanthomonas arboricola]MDN0203790.1 zf-HC2 domain-containing protein [Xanthomonas arboricola pv. corylina]MDN0207613.1 zf-HC2 domain-containing protein [Xanthomonas arboricola pv. corylina]MDN0212005.1 zf-HC2 domain-containing protein [Xanthomonas arboricola pv. corylina]MDN0216855.1 zf-HC2 domain-containing protein [Xanthomonas arboricola pv. corylina]QUI79203.1 zf-HC2 domain-containing protein [Xanthomonas arboricola pv. corylina]
MKTFFIAPGKECSHAWELMPAVLLDSATEEENTWLIAHVAKCASCSAEFAQQNRLRQALALPSAVKLDANTGLQRLLGRLDAPEQASAPAPPAARRSGSWTVRALAAAALVQAIGLGVMGVRLAAPAPSHDYRTLSSATAQPVPQGAIRVVPDAKMTVADWDRLLHAQQLQVIGGPNEMGAYTVVPAQPQPPAQPQQTVQQLRANPGIRMAEIVSAP